MTDREFSALIAFIGLGLTLVGTAYALLPLQAIGIGMAGTAALGRRAR